MHSLTSRFHDSSSWYVRVTNGIIRGSTLLQRWIFAWMVSLGSMNSFAMRTCLSIAITDMVVIERIIPNGTNSEDSFPAESTSSRSTRGETYEWDEYTQVRHPSDDVNPEVCFIHSIKLYEHCCRESSYQVFPGPSESVNYRVYI